MNVTRMYMYTMANRWIICKFKFRVRLEELLALPKVIEEWLSGLFAPVLPPFDHRLMSHGTKFSMLSTLCACAVLY